MNLHFPNFDHRSNSMILSSISFIRSSSKKACASETVSVKDCMKTNTNIDDGSSASNIYACVKTSLEIDNREIVS